MSHAALQQLPVPEMPHTAEWQAWFEVQAAPSASVAEQVPPLQKKPLTQSAPVLQLVRQLVASAQFRLPAQATGVPGMQTPPPRQELAVSMPD